MAPCVVVYRGQALGLDQQTFRAGIAAMDGRRADAVAGYREAIRGWHAAGLPFDEALAVVDMASVLGPTEREMAEAPSLIEDARATLARLRATPFLERLDVRPSGGPTRSSVAAEVSATSTDPAGAAAG